MRWPVRRRINYAALDVEELGSVYESLLEYQPVFVKTSGIPEFDFVAGMERKTTGSYYTRPELVKELVNSALVPVIEDRLADARKSKKDGEEALLSVKVCDPACGSGHFLLSAARRIAYELAKVRTKTEEPSPDEMRVAVRDVITHCIYGVDRNPLAVDLCKVALWIEGHGENKPLTFLDHRIRCGDSLVGVLDMMVLEDGFPDEAFSPVTGDDKGTARSLKKENKEQRGGGRTLPLDGGREDKTLRELFDPILELPDDTPEQVRKKRRAFEHMHSEGTRLWHDEAACNLWTGAFFANLTDDARDAKHIPTTDDLWSFMWSPGGVDARLPAHAWQLQSEHRFFHWPLEFPDVFEGGGFDVVLCNPPWERIKLQEQEFFSTRDHEIAGAANKAARGKLIKKLPESNPALWGEYRDTLHYADALSKFLRASGRFPLTARGDINTYSVFAELIRELLSPTGRAGILCPTGIATDDTNKAFFGDLIRKQSLAQFLGMDNEAMLFPSIDHRNKFALLTITGAETRTEKPLFTSACSKLDYTKLAERRYTLRLSDFDLLNPNTLTCPVFRTKADAELTKRIFERVPVLVNERTGENPWGVSFLRMFDMANDSHLFRTHEQLEGEGFRLSGNRFVKGDEVWLPLYESKMMWHYDHRYATFEGATKANLNSGSLPKATPHQKSDPFFALQPRYWVESKRVDEQLANYATRRYFICFRNVTSYTLERTAVFSTVPRTAVGNSAPLLLPTINSASLFACLVGNLSSLVFDYVVRQKVAGVNMNFFLLEQFPLLTPDMYTGGVQLFIGPRTLELMYTSWDTKPFADDVWRDADDSLRGAIRKQWEENKAATGGNEWEPPEWAKIEEDGIPLPPFKWDEGRRALLRAELDAYYARLYGLSHKQLRYILDPADLTERELADILDPYQEVGDPLDEDAYSARCESSTFPGETFRVLRDKEMKQFGEYRTRRLVLEAFEQLGG